VKPSPRVRDALLVLLALCTGATDATAFDRLGHVFASVITGNLVVLGVAAASAAGRLALLSGCALAGYAVGVAIAAPQRAELDTTVSPGLWPAPTTRALVKELVVLGAFAICWEVAAPRPSHTWQSVLVVIAGVAMGIQSTAVRRFGQLSTTYLTSTLTGVIEAVASRRFSEVSVRSLAILAMAAAGAAAAIGVLRLQARALPVLQLLPVALVIVGSLRLTSAARSKQ
jgi:uncharacterized membrane protein YoaK (UPF0700 family)